MMRRPEDIDKNFRIEKKVVRDGLTYHNAADLDVYGVQLVDGLYRRMPDDIAKEVSEKVGIIAQECAGGRIRFVTDSPYVAVSARYNAISRVPNYSFTSTTGFDLYSGDQYVGAFVPAIDCVDAYEGVLDIENADGGRVYTLNLPVCAQIKEIYIGVKEGSILTRAPKYAMEKPIVLYGSSVTQGSCASRPGNSYANMISRALDCNYINLAFWGNALGEDRIAEYIAGLDMSAFIYDYDYNAPNVEHLRATHEKMFKIIRKAQPNLPIIMLSAPRIIPTKTGDERTQVVKDTYDHAVANGDKNVVFLSGEEILRPIASVALADNIHPADIGFWAISQAICQKIKQMLK